MNNTTYFLGAGASSGITKTDEKGIVHNLTGIPIVKNTFVSYDSFVRQIKHILLNDYMQ